MSKAAKPPASVAVNWEGQDISGQQHEGVAFADLEATELTNRGAVFTNCSFHRAQFNCSVHTDAAFVNCTFHNCSFFEAKFTDCKFVGSAFHRCTFDLMQLHGGNWSHVALAGADFRRVIVRGTRLREADLSRLNAQDGSLRDADLSGATFDGANLIACDLRGSDLSALDPTRVSIKGARVTMEQAVVLAEALGAIVD